MTAILLVTPLRKEFDALAGFFTSEGYKSENFQSKTTAARFPELDITIAAGGGGKASFAVAAQYLIDTCGPFSLFIAAGTAGALDQALKPGDVILGTETVEHDYKSRFGGNEFLQRHISCADSRRAISDVHREQNSFTLRTGPIASGDEDIIEPRRARELRGQTGALCVAWEGAGGARAAKFNGIPFLEIRAITDLADSDTPKAFYENLAAAMINIGRVLLPWLTHRRNGS